MWCIVRVTCLVIVNNANDTVQKAHFYGGGGEKHGGGTIKNNSTLLINFPHPSYLDNLDVH